MKQGYELGFWTMTMMALLALTCFILILCGIDNIGITIIGIINICGVVIDLITLWILRFL